MLINQVTLDLGGFDDLPQAFSKYPPRLKTANGINERYRKY